jgi:DNA repair exonuclease SbcCD nuclease subunit
MTSLFVADIHLNLRSNKEWEQSRFLTLFKHLANHTADTIILGGDIFDLPKPSLEEINTFYTGIGYLKDKTVYLISGNHENLSETKTVFDYLPHVGFIYLENTMLSVKGYDLYFVSHIKCKQIVEYKKELSSSRKNILFSHFRANYGTFIKGEIDVKEVSDIFDFCFVGDIHHVYSPYHNVYYPSSPYGIHYEVARDYGVYVIDFGVEFKFTWERLHLPSKILVETTEDTIDLSGLDENNRYKVVVKGSPSTKITSTLMKDTRVASFDYKPTEVEDTEEFEKLVDELSSHIEEDITDTIIKLVKSTDFVLDEETEKYLKAVMLDVRN